MSKKTKTNFKKNLIPEVSHNEQIIGWLNDQAHKGSPDSIKNLEKFIANENNKSLKGYAECALDEANFFYYCADTKQEKNDFILAKLIREREEETIKYIVKADQAKYELKKLGIDKNVHVNLLKANNKQDEIEWKYEFCDDTVIMVKQRLAEIEHRIDYLLAWLEQARKMIKSKKYKTIPQEILDHIHDCDEGFSLWEDEDCYECNSRK